MCFKLIFQCNCNLQKLKDVNFWVKRKTPQEFHDPYTSGGPVVCVFVAFVNVFMSKTSVALQHLSLSGHFLKKQSSYKNDKSTNHLNFHKFPSHFEQKINPPPHKILNTLFPPIKNTKKKCPFWSQVPFHHLDLREKKSAPWPWPPYYVLAALGRFANMKRRSTKSQGITGWQILRTESNFASSGSALKKAPRLGSRLVEFGKNHG